MHELRADVLLRQMTGQPILEQAVFDGRQLGEEPIILKHHRQASLPQFIKIQFKQAMSSAFLRRDCDLSSIVGAQSIEEHTQRSLAAA